MINRAAADQVCSHKRRRSGNADRKSLPADPFSFHEQQFTSSRMGMAGGS